MGAMCGCRACCQCCRGGSHRYAGIFGCLCENVLQIMAVGIANMIQYNCSSMTLEMCLCILILCVWEVG